MNQQEINQYLLEAEESLKEEVRKDGSERAQLEFELRGRKKINRESLQELDALLLGPQTQTALEKHGVSLPMEYFKKQKQNFLHFFLRAVRMSKDIAVESGVNPDIANVESFIEDKIDEPALRKAYNEKIDKQRSALEENDFSSKNLALYVVFGLLLCSGDLLMGDYLANQVLGLGKTWWGGLVLALFAISLGVVMEIVLSMLYNKYKLIARIIMAFSLIFTIAMFAAMGILRSSQFMEALTGTANFDHSSLLLFFCGMALAAPTALGSVLFIIQKKIYIIRIKKELDIQQQALGRLMNLIVEFKEKWTNYEQVLVPEFVRGYVSRLSSLITQGDSPSSNGKGGPSQGNGDDLITRMKRDVREHYQFSAIAGLFMCLSLFSCGEASSSLESQLDMAYIMLDAETVQAQTFIQTHLPDKPVSSLSLHLPEGSFMQGFEDDKGGSMIASSYHHRKKQADVDRFVSDIHLPPSDPQPYSLELFGTLLSNASSQSRFIAQDRTLIIHLSTWPTHLLSRTDQEIRDLAIEDADLLRNLRSLELHELLGANAQIYLELNPLSQPLSKAEIIRKNRLYFQRLLYGFQIYLDLIDEYKN
ncbi:MAG: hypothetical protein AAF587_19420 [Bacteroidota bacterium]